MADQPAVSVPQTDDLYLCTSCYSMVHPKDGCCPKCGRPIR